MCVSSRDVDRCRVRSSRSQLDWHGVLGAASIYKVFWGCPPRYRGRCPRQCAERCSWAMPEGLSRAVLGKSISNKCSGPMRGFMPSFKQHHKWVLVALTLLMHLSLASAQDAAFGAFRPNTAWTASEDGISLQNPSTASVLQFQKQRTSHLL